MQTVALACRSPADLGLPLVRWSVRSLAAQLVDDGVFTEIHYSTVCLILQEADLQPHRRLYWKNSDDPDFGRKAVRVLWYYQRAASLRRRGVYVFCLDEKPNLQLLGRPFPDLPMRPGRPLRREHEYDRLGTANLVLIHDLVTGELFGRSVAHNRSPHLTAVPDRHVASLPQARQIHYILDNGPTHGSHHTRDWSAAQGGRVRFHFTPTGASWLDQAEIALSVFSRRYLRDRLWTERAEFAPHIRRSIAHHNRSHARPFDWSFTRDRLVQWRCCRN